MVSVDVKHHVYLRPYCKVSPGTPTAFTVGLGVISSAGLSHFFVIPSAGLSHFFVISSAGLSHFFVISSAGLSHFFVISSAGLSNFFEAAFNNALS